MAVVVMVQGLGRRFYQGLLKLGGGGILLGVL